MAKETKAKLFIKLAKPDENWVSRRVKKSEFIWEYSDLYFENWCSRWRSDWPLAKKYIIERRYGINSKWVKSVSEIRLNWFSNDDLWQAIRTDIKKFYKAKRCVVLWTSNPEVDHKDWRKNNAQVMRTRSQKFDDFQPLSKAANDAKRQFCKECKRTNKRYDAKLLWYPISFTKWDENYSEEIWCEWCFWYDPIAFRSKLKFSWDN